MSRAWAYARLVRLPNVFTALADVGVGAVVARTAGVGRTDQVLIFAASACLYMAGMAWNDWVDREEDRRDRPFRPIPSGAVPPTIAARIGTALIIVAMVLLSATVSLTAMTLGGVLVAAILGYNFSAKFGPTGPAVMGGCRVLNVLLGFALIPTEIAPWPLRCHAAMAIGLHVGGLSLLARRETGGVRPRDVRAAWAVMAVGWLSAAAVPAHVAPGTASIAALPALAGFVLGQSRLLYRAHQKPEQGRVVAAVKAAIFGVIVLDAIIAAGIAGPAGWWLLALVPPAWWAGRRIHST